MVDVSANGFNSSTDSNNLRQLRLLVRMELNRLEDKHLALQTEGTLKKRVRETTSVWELEHIVRDLLSLDHCSTAARRHRYRLAAYTVQHHGYQKIAIVAPFILQQVVQHTGMDNQQASIAELAGLVKELTVAAFQFHCDGNSLGAEGNWLSLMFLQPLIRPAVKAPASTKAAIAFYLAFTVLTVFKDWMDHEPVIIATRECLIFTIRHMPAGPRVPEGFLPLKQCIQLLGRKTGSLAIQQAVKLCVDGMKHKDSWQVRRQATEALGSIAASILGDTSGRVSSHEPCPAIEGFMGSKDPILAALREARYDANAQVRQQASQTLAELQKLPAVPLPYQGAQGAEQEPHVRDSSRTIGFPSTPRTAAKKSPLQTFNRAVRSFLSPAGLTKSRPAPSVPQYPFQRPELSSTDRQELDFGVQVFSLARPQPPIPLASTRQETSGAQDSIQPVAMYSGQQSEDSPDVRPLEHGARLLNAAASNGGRSQTSGGIKAWIKGPNNVDIGVDIEMPSGVGGTEPSAKQKILTRNNQLHPIEPVASSAAASAALSPTGPEPAISPSITRVSPLRQPWDSSPTPPRRPPAVPKLTIPNSDAAGRGMKAAAIAGAARPAWRTPRAADALPQGRRSGQWGQAGRKNASVQAAKPSPDAARRSQAFSQMRQSGASAAGRQTRTTGLGSRLPPTLRQSITSTIGSQGSCLDQLLQNPEALGASESQLRQLSQFFNALSVRTSQALEAVVANERPATHRSSRLPRPPIFTPRGPAASQLQQPSPGVAGGYTPRRSTYSGDVGSGRPPPWAPSSRPSSADSQGSSRVTSGPPSPSMDPSVLPLALQVFNCGIQDLCAPGPAANEHNLGGFTPPGATQAQEEYSQPQEFAESPDSNQEQAHSDGNDAAVVLQPQDDGEDAWAMDTRSVHGGKFCGEPPVTACKPQGLSNSGDNSTRGERLIGSGKGPQSSERSARGHTQSNIVNAGLRVPSPQQRDAPENPKQTESRKPQPGREELPSMKVPATDEPTGLKVTTRQRGLSMEMGSARMDDWLTASSQATLGHGSSAAAPHVPDQPAAVRHRHAQMEDGTGEPNTGTCSEAGTPPSVAEQDSSSAEEYAAARASWHGAVKQGRSAAQPAAQGSYTMVKVDHDAAACAGSSSAVQTQTQPRASPGKKRAQPDPESQPSKRAAGGPKRPLPPLKMPQRPPEPTLQPDEADSPQIEKNHASASGLQTLGLLESLDTFADKFLLESRLDFRASTQVAEEEAWAYLQSSLPASPFRAKSKAHQAARQDLRPAKQHTSGMPRRKASPLKPDAEPTHTTLAPEIRGAGPSRASTDVHCNPLFDSDSTRAANKLAVLRLTEGLAPPLGLPAPKQLPQQVFTAGKHLLQQASTAAKPLLQQLDAAGKQVPQQLSATGASTRQQAEEHIQSSTSSGLCDEAHRNGRRYTSSGSSTADVALPVATSTAAAPGARQPLWLDDHAEASDRLSKLRAQVGAAAGKPPRPSAFQRRLLQSARALPELRPVAAREVAIEDQGSRAVPAGTVRASKAAPPRRIKRKYATRPGYSTLFDSSSESEDE